MPPEFRSTPVGSRDLLAQHGLVERRPPVRSSDFRSLGSPFHYYLTRKLGLVPALRYSVALSQGTWFHAALELLMNPSNTVESAHIQYQAKLEARIDEMRSVCKELSIGDQRTREIVAVEEQDATCGWAWSLVSKDLPIEGSLANGRSMHEFLGGPDFVPLCNECLLRTDLTLDDKRMDPVTCVMQPDLLLFHKPQRSVWIVDYKTTGISPRIRGASCPIEPQTQHYMSIAHDLLQRGQLQKQFDLPDDTTVGGMLHAIVRKPTISFGQSDRDYILDTTPFKSGPRKGEPRNEKVYTGEPRLENYIERCRQWYMGEKDYVHLKADRVAEPLVDLSFTSGTALLDKQWVGQYRARLAALNKWRIAEIEPHEYPWPTEVHGTGTLDTYAPFVLRPVSEWPDIVMQEGFVIVDRDAPKETANVQ
jgi:hypothetical protein